jgi:putative sigma-54 modulation protein
MQTRITARHFEASDGLRSHVADELGKLGRYFDRIHDAHVILLDAPAADSRAEIALNAPHQTFTAAHAAPTIEAAVDGCVRQLRRQVGRHKDRLRRRKGAETARA